MKRIKINEDLNTRGMNELYYQIEIWNINQKNNNESLNRSYQYLRKNANLLHETSIFKFIKGMDGQIWNDEQCDEYCNKLNQVLDLINKIEDIY